MPRRPSLGLYWRRAEYGKRTADWVAGKHTMVGDGETIVIPLTGDTRRVKGLQLAPSLGPPAGDNQ